MPTATPNHQDTDELLRRVASGDLPAQEQLFDRHRGRLRGMVAMRMDGRLAGRLDPSDVVQETLLAASKQLEAYVRERPLPFYPWLRQLAWRRLVDLHHRHVTAKKRTVTREDELALSDQSVLVLAERFAHAGSSPSLGLLQQELRDRVRAALEQLSATDREVVAMRHIEQMAVEEIAATLGLSASAVKMRVLRAVQRLRAVLGDASRP